MVIKNYSILDIFWMLWENFKWLLYIWLFLCRVRRLFWSAPSFLRWRDQNFTPSAQAGSPPSLEVSWQHTYYTRYSNTHFRCRKLGNDVFKRLTLMNATYFFGNDLFTLGLVFFFRGGGGFHFENLLIIIPQYQWRHTIHIVRALQNHMLFYAEFLLFIHFYVWIIF